jgi:parallel beta-helix repeat protein
LATSLASGNAITVLANDVTLDCNGFKIDGTAAGAGTKTMAIRANSRFDVTVRHCNVQGFYFGVYLYGATGGHVVEDNSFQDNTYTGITVEGDGSVVRRNTVLDTGGSTVWPHAHGIITKYSVDVIDNTVSGVFAASGINGDTTGILTYSNPNGSISGNRVRGVLKGGTGTARGIDNVTSGRLLLTDNDVVGNASAGSVGLRCTVGGARAKGNVISGFGTAIGGCGAADGNDLSP